MAVIGTRVVVTLNKKSGITADAIQNVFHFSGNLPENAEADIRDCVTGFYNGRAVEGSTANMRYWMGDDLATATSAMSMLMFRVHDDTLLVGAPFQEFVWTLGARRGISPSVLPAELAIALSITAATTGIAEHGAGDTRPAARRRGRLYLGTWDDDILSPDATTRETTVASLVRTTVAGAGAQLMSEATTAGYPWCVFSRRDLTMREVVGGWVDDAFDSQRRRGREASVRTSFGTP